MINNKLIHYTYAEWQKYSAIKNVRVTLFSYNPSKSQDFENMSEFFYNTKKLAYSYKELQNSGYIAAKLVLKPDVSATIRVDRDYYEVDVMTVKGSRTIMLWQSSQEVKGFKLYELWLNIFKILDKA